MSNLVVYSSTPHIWPPQDLGWTESEIPLVVCNKSTLSQKHRVQEFCNKCYTLIFCNSPSQPCIKGFSTVITDYTTCVAFSPRGDLYFNSGKLPECTYLGIPVYYLFSSWIIKCSIVMLLFCTVQNMYFTRTFQKQPPSLTAPNSRRKFQVENYKRIHVQLSGDSGKYLNLSIISVSQLVGGNE